MAYDNEMRFVLFRNDKNGNDKRPDYRGTAQVGGVEYKLSAWIKESAKGKFVSGMIELPKPKDGGQAAATKPAQAAQTQPKANATDEEIPF